MKITYGRGGWVSVDEVGLPGLLYLRLSPNDEVTELYLAPGAGPLTAAHLRRLQLGKIVTLAAGRPDLRAMGLGDQSGPDLAKVLPMLVPRRQKRPEPDQTATLEPPAAGLTDYFLRDVARAYAAAVARGEHPNQALAHQTQTPQRTVERWVYLSRKAGFLSGGRSTASRTGRGGQ